MIGWTKDYPLRDFITNLKETWNKFSRNQKIGVGVGFAATLLLVVFFAAAYSEEDYVPLFDYINDRREALAVVNKLKELGYRPKMTEGGHIVSVAKSRKEAAHLALAQNNSLPDAVASYSEIMDGNSSFGLTEKELDLRIKRSQQGNLSKTIMQYRNIKQAKVTIAEARDTLFSEDQKDTRVSVLITMENPLEKIAAEQVKTIINLVKHSILGVKKENIHISDDKGNDLIAMLVQKGKELSHHELTVLKEKELRRKASQTLAEIWGEFNVKVEVSLQLDFDNLEEESKELAPPVAGEEQGVKISEETKETENSTMDPKAIPGTTTNIPGYQQPEKTLSQSKSKESRINYAYKSKKVKLKRAVGMIKRMTVSVVLNKDVLPDRELSQQVREGIVGLVSNAIGLDPQGRRDQISVQAFAFNKKIFEKRKLRLVEKDDFANNLASTGVVCALAATLLWIFRQYRRNQKENRERALEIAQQSISEQQDFEEEVMTVEQRERHERERFLMETARESPDDIVKIIRSMMMEENHY